MNKNILLAAAALSVLATAGAANAASISARAGAVPVTPSAPYTLARELNYSAGITSAVGEFDTIVRTNNPLQAGTYTITVTYAGATINSAVSTATVTQLPAAPTTLTNDAAAGFEDYNANGATLTLSSGGSVGSNSVSYTLQVPASGGVQSLYFAPALKVNGPVSVTASVVNLVTGQPVDPSVIQSLITTTTQGFAAVATPDTAGSSRIQAGSAPRFRTLTEGLLGQVRFAVADTAGNISTFLNASGTSDVAYKDLIGTPVAATDVTGGNVVVTGSLTNLTLSATNSTSVAQTSNSATIVLPAGAATSAISVAVTDAANGAQLVPSTYKVSGSYTLGSAFAGSLPFTSTSLETINTEGLTYVVPWVSSATQSASTGSRTVIRMSRVGTNVANGGNVYAQILNPLKNAATVTGDYKLVGTLGSSGELVLSSSTFETAFGDFGRADIRLVLTPSNGAGYATYTPATTNNVIVKRVIAQPNGGVAEMDVVSVGAPGSANPTVGF
jgi:hypothetical protein